MREQSEYEVTCECGAKLRSHERFMICGACSRNIEIRVPHWVKPTAMDKLCGRIVAEQGKKS